MSGQGTIETAKKYYNSREADEFYHAIWGGEDIHVGIYETEHEAIATASRRTVETMLARIPVPHAEHHVLDIGSGYGGAARQIAAVSDCRITCLNLSEVQNARNIEKNRAIGLDDRIKVLDGAFEEIPLPDEDCEIVWSEDALLHSADRERVLAEVYRVLKPGGMFIFTDPMERPDCPAGALQSVYDRIHLDSLATFDFYIQAGERIGYTRAEITDLSPHLTRHYTRVKEELVARYEEVVALSEATYVDRMIEGLQHWIGAGERGYLAWGIIQLWK